MIGKCRDSGVSVRGKGAIVVDLEKSTTKG